MPIKYIEGNLIKNIYDEWWAYYCFEPYNYSFSGQQDKLNYFNRLRQLIGQTRFGNIHILQISTEESLRDAQERSKAHAIGSLRDIALEKIDIQSQILIDGEWDSNDYEMNDEPFYVGETQIDYKFYIGFRLIPTEEAGLKNFLEGIASAAKDFANSVSKNLMGDYEVVSNEEYERYSRIEKLMYSKISRLNGMRQLSVDEIGYVIEHIYGKTGTPYEEYHYHLPYERTEDGAKVKKYDVLKLSKAEITEHPKHIVFSHDSGEQVYCSYLTISDIVGELEFPGSEILYFQQQHFDFAVDTSINVEVIANKKALSTVRNKKKGLKDLDDHAYKSGNETSGDVTEALATVSELEDDLNATKDAMYCMSYIVRVTAPDKDELTRRINSLVDFYDNFNIKLVRPSGDMMAFHSEFIPTSRRMNSIKKHVKSDFLACLGIGASEIIGEKDGIALGHTKYSQRFIYVKPWIAAQGIAGTVTNSLSACFIGALGGGKSFANNFIVHQAVLFGALAVIIDPKGERGGWKDALPEIADEINIVNLTSDESNVGLLDPFIIMRDVKDGESLALDVLTYLLGITIQDNDRYPVLRRAVRAVAQKERRGLLLVIEELNAMGDETASGIASHIESFTDFGLAQLLFSDGNFRNHISLDKKLNIIQIADLILPSVDTKQSDYSTTEMLSVAAMVVISTFCLDFIHSDRSTFKIVDIDESWALLNVNQGKTLTNKLIREGRAMNGGLFLSTQTAKDVDDEAIKNNIGMFFIFRSNDLNEIKNSLRLLGVDEEDEENQDMIRNLENGECVMKDIYGHVNVIKVDYLLPELKRAFDTRPKLRSGDDEAD